MTSIPSFKFSLKNQNSKRPISILSPAKLLSHEHRTILYQDRRVYRRPVVAATRARLRDRALGRHGRATHRAKRCNHFCSYTPFTPRSAACSSQNCLCTIRLLYKGCENCHISGRSLTLAIIVWQRFEVYARTLIVARVATD